MLVVDGVRVVVRIETPTPAQPLLAALIDRIAATLDPDARRKIALWRYDYNAVRPHSSLGNLTPLEARRTLALTEGAAPGAIAMKPTADYQSQTGRLSL